MDLQELKHQLNEISDTVCNYYTIASWSNENCITLLYDLPNRINHLLKGDVVIYINKSETLKSA